MKKLTIALLSGGISTERQVSLDSGDQVFEALDKEKYRVIRYDPKTDLNRLVADSHLIDAALIIMHGAFGEDGTVQGLLDLLGIPYQGTGVLGSSIAMNKLASKQLYALSNLPVPPFMSVKHGEKIDPRRYIKRLGLPLVIKPSTGGSSIGMSIVTSEEKLQGAIDDALRHDEKVLVETYVQGVELTGSVIGNDNLDALPIVEIIPDKSHAFFDYEAKYTPGITREICPARIDEAVTERAKRFAKMAHRALYCRGYSRTDMILKDRELYILETNTIPGMTANSLLPLAASVAGISFRQLLDKLIQLSLESSDRNKRRRIVE